MAENVAQHKIAFTKNEAMHKTTESVFFVRAKDQWLAKVFEGCKNYKESRNLSNEPQDACRVVKTLNKMSMQLEIMQTVVSEKSWIRIGRIGY